MSNLQILACPSCGGSIPVSGDEREVTCQFCGNTVVVPLALRTGSATRTTILPKHTTLFVFLGAMGFIYCLCAGLTTMYYFYASLSYYR